MAVLPKAEQHGDVVTVRNIRDFNYMTENDYVVNYYDRSYDIRQLKTVDFIIVPFTEWRGAAHTFLSFGFEGDDYLSVSVEIRRQKGDDFDFWKALLSQYEITYVVGDERDLINLRANYRNTDVYVYRIKNTPAQTRALFRDVMARVNQLNDKPELYNLVTNNCTTNLIRHVNNVSPKAIPYNYQVLFTGYSDELAYQLKLIDTSKSFEQTKEDAHINRLAEIYKDDPEFSKKIRR